MRYLLFNKPYGVLTQFTDRLTDSNRLSRDTLKSYIEVPDVYPVGRLDRDSEGLLLLTDDGWLAAQLIHPQYGHKRIYWAQVEGIPTDSAIQKLQRGVTIKGHQTLPAKVRAIAEPRLPERSVPIRYRKSVPTSWLELCLTEGKNRQVRRMTAAVGFPTLRLVRTQIACLTLQGLDLGQWRDLTPIELQTLRKLVNPRSLTGISMSSKSSSPTLGCKSPRNSASRNTRSSRSSRQARRSRK
ncbi:MAG: pseudouridine synthase [Synechococcus sp.]